MLVNIIAENGLTSREVSVNNALDGLAQKRMAELRIALRPRPDGFLEVMSQRHYCVSRFFLRLYPM